MLPVVAKEVSHGCKRTKASSKGRGVETANCELPIQTETKILIELVKKAYGVAQRSVLLERITLISFINAFQKCLFVKHFVKQCPLLWTLFYMWSYRKRVSDRQQIIVNGYIAAPMAQVENRYRHDCQSVIHNRQTIFLGLDTIFSAYLVVALDTL